MSRAARIRAALEAAFTPTLLEVIDDSARHAGHAGNSGVGETHFNVKIVSNSFMNLNRVERARRVHIVLADELASGLHALGLRLHAPGEVAE
jgi:BolA protein